ncbi:MAG: CRISPR-associated endonuclease Cas2 [Thiohalocapsa sp.]|jgi:CRISPR-associated protein Cas2|uniref:CRISPR-associated endonuclease Cas2 n=1 Tax=Thiohalocapsa sp. TaxID=2497641 RepID=UPI0025E84526|nr:CRISPR-associated endonuclease Cas2 [Thiohalocapsa sp.]MCG6940640.1 CRISPR-associated endonuclease Cas2 [Thiohalocapsa sp.]
MSQRKLYIAAYDIADDGRLRDALKLLKGYASGRQKSVFECFLSPAERAALLAGTRGILDPVEDRFALLRLEPRGKCRVLGRAVKPADPPWFYVG